MNHFFDGGAHHGEIFDYLPKHPELRIGTVWCFEPSLRHLPVLIERAKQQPNYMVRVCPFGLWHMNGTRTFFERSDPMGDSFVRDAYYREGNSLSLEAVYPAAVISTAEFLTQRCEPKSVVMKLDIEGAEYLVLDSVLRRPEASLILTKVMVEWHHVSGQADKEDLIRRTLDAGIEYEEWKS